MKETKEQIIYDLQICKGYMRMPREVQRNRELSASDKYIAALIFSYSNTRKENSTCTRTYAEFSKDLNVSCATTSRAFKRLKEHLKGAIEQVRRATYRFDRSALSSSSYIIVEHYFRKNTFTFSDGSARQLSRHAAQAAPILYERFINDSKSRPWKTDPRQKFTIHAPMAVQELAKLLGTSEKTAAKTLSELLACGIIFIKGKYKQLNGYSCRDFKPSLKLFEAILEVRAMKKYNLTEAQEQAQLAEKQQKELLEYERDKKIAKARKEHSEAYKPLFDKWTEFIKILSTGRDLTAAEENEFNYVDAELNRLDEFYINSGWVLGELAP